MRPSICLLLGLSGAAALRAPALALRTGSAASLHRPALAARRPPLAPRATVRAAAAASAVAEADEKLPPAMLPITLTVLAQMIGEGIALTSLPLHMSRLGATTVLTGIAVSAFSLASVLFTPVVVRISSKVGRFKVLRACLLGCAVAQLIISSATTPLGVVIGRFIAGIFAASVPVAQAAVTDLVKPSQSALALSRVSAVSQLGVVVGPAVGALGITILTGLGVPDIAGRHMRCVFAASATFALSVLGAQLALGGVEKEKEAEAAAPPEPPPSAAEINMEGRRETDALPLSSNITELVKTLPLATEVRSGGDPAQWALRLVAISLGWGLTLSMATYCLFGSAMVGYAQSQLSINFSVAAAITVVTQLVFFPKLVKRLGEHLVCALGLTASAAGLLGFSLVRLNPLHQIVYFLSRMGNALGDTACATLVARASDGSEARARNLGMIYSVRAGARIVTPLLSAWLFEISRRNPLAPGALPYFIVSAITLGLIPVPLALKSFEDKSAKAKAKAE